MAVKIRAGSVSIMKETWTGLYDQIWRTRNKEESNIALNMSDMINRNRTDQKENQFGEEKEKLSAKYLEVILELI